MKKSEKSGEAQVKKVEKKKSPSLSSTDAAAKSSAKKTTKKKDAPAASSADLSPSKKLSSSYVPRLLQHYRESSDTLKKTLGVENPMQLPKLEKIIVNIGQGDATQNIKVLESAVSELASITGQKPFITKAKKSIAGFKLRAGQPIGCAVTLRGYQMYEFLDRLINIAIPRIRDFRGYSPKSFDGRGNYTLGVKEQIVFPEIDYDKLDKVRGLGISLITSAKNDVHARALLDVFNFPFRK
ncbi:MAG: 50S ribosomal protein L5 [Oligoflexales bacterium]|nr:50S ribosomal protein L5 [Oligoflexales bacterium]